jgi:hypothetical protein
VHGGDKIGVMAMVAVAIRRKVFVFALRLDDCHSGDCFQRMLITLPVHFNLPSNVLPVEAKECEPVVQLEEVLPRIRWQLCRNDFVSTHLRVPKSHCNSAPLWGERFQDARKTDADRQVRTDAHINAADCTRT